MLYFNPKDTAPGCTIGAMPLNAALEEFAGPGARVIGVSGDIPKSHLAFAARHSHPVLLLSDTEHAVLKSYFYSWKPETMSGWEFFLGPCPIPSSLILPGPLSRSGGR